ncbi:MAG: energy transducer TonB [Saprospiraceae bacterium]
MTSNLSFSATEVIGVLGVVLLIIATLITFGKRYFRNLSESDLTEKYKDKKWSSPLEARNKYPDVDVFSYRDMVFRLSLVMVMALTIGFFNLTTEPEKSLVPDGAALMLNTDIEVELPRTQDVPPPPPPPPPPPVIQEIPEGVMTDVEDVDFVDQSVDANSEVSAAPIMEHREERKVVAPPPPPPPVAEEEEIFKVVEEAPRFPGCDDLATIQDKQACANKKLLEFIYKNIEYPAIARENNIEGTVVVRFVVDKDGTVKDAQVVREIGGGCGEEAVRVVKLMNEMPERWSPGKQRGRPVKVYFTLPVKFILKVDP